MGVEAVVTERRATAGALLLDGSGRALLGLRAGHKAVAAGCWDIVGGRVEAGETVEQTLVRELREELAITATRFTALTAITDPDADGLTHHVFAVTGWDGSPTNASDEHDEIRWFPLNDILRLPNRTPFDFADLFERAARLAGFQIAGSRPANEEVE